MLNTGDDSIKILNSELLKGFKMIRSLSVATKNMEANS